MQAGKLADSAKLLKSIMYHRNNSEKTATEQRANSARTAKQSAVPRRNPPHVSTACIQMVCARGFVKNKTRTSLEGAVAGSTLYLDVDEDEFEPVGVDDIVLDPGFAKVGLASDQLGLARATRFFEA